MDVYASQLQQIKDQLTEYGFLNNPGFPKKVPDAGLLEEVALARQLGRERYDQDPATTSYIFVINLEGCIGRRGAPAGVCLSFNWDHLNQQATLRSMGISAGRIRSAVFDADKTLLPKVGEFSARLTDAYLGRRVAEGVRMEAVKLAETLHKKGYIKDPVSWQQALLYQLVESRYNKPDLEEHRLMLSGRAPGLNMQVATTVTFNKEKERLELGAILLSTGDNTVDIKPRHPDKLPAAKYIKTYLAMEDRQRRLAAFQTMPLSFRFKEEGALRQQLIRTSKTYCGVGEVADTLRGQGWLGNKDADKLYNEFRQLAFDASQQLRMWVDDHTKRFSFSVHLNINPGARDKLNMQVNLTWDMNRFHLEHRGMILSQGDADLCCNPDTDAVQGRQRLEAQLQVDAVAEQLYDSGCLVHQKNFADLLTGQLSPLGMSEYKSPHLLSVDLNEYRFEENQLPLKALLQIDRHKASCRLICIQAERNGVQLRVFPDHKQCLPNAGVVMNKLAISIAEQERHQQASAILSHSPPAEALRKKR